MQLGVGMVSLCRQRLGCQTGESTGSSRSVAGVSAHAFAPLAALGGSPGGWRAC